MKKSICLVIAGIISSSCTPRNSGSATLDATAQSVADTNRIAMSGTVGVLEKVDKGGSGSVQCAGTMIDLDPNNDLIGVVASHNCSTYFPNGFASSAVIVADPKPGKSSPQTFTIVDSGFVKDEEASKLDTLYGPGLVVILASGKVDPSLKSILISNKNKLQIQAEDTFFGVGFATFGVKVAGKMSLQSQDDVSAFYNRTAPNTHIPAEYQKLNTLMLPFRIAGEGDLNSKQEAWARGPVYRISGGNEISVVGFNDSFVSASVDGTGGLLYFSVDAAKLNSGVSNLLAELKSKYLSQKNSAQSNTAGASETQPKIAPSENKTVPQKAAADGAKTEFTAPKFEFISNGNYRISFEAKNTPKVKVVVDDTWTIYDGGGGLVSFQYQFSKFGSRSFKIMGYDDAEPSIPLATQTLDQCVGQQNDCF